MTTSVAIGVGYLLVAVACSVAWRTERRQGRPGAGAGGPFWLLTAALYAMLATGRLTNAATSAADVGRHLAESEGWYDNRRPLQALATVGIFAVWAVVVGMAVTRHRNHAGPSLAMTFVTTSLMLLAAARAISLHAVDSAFERTRVLDVELGDVLEIIGLVAALAIANYSVPRGVQGVASDL